MKRQAIHAFVNHGGFFMVAYSMLVASALEIDGISVQC